MMKIDIFNHIFPKIFYDKMMEVNPNSTWDDLVLLAERVDQMLWWKNKDNGG